MYSINSYIDRSIKADIGTVKYSSHLVESR